MKNRDAAALGRLGGRPPAGGTAARSSSASAAKSEKTNRHAVALGRIGGRKGGPRGGRRRAEVLSARRRSEIAAEAARVRWGGLPAWLRPLFPGYHFEDIRLPEQLDLVMLHLLSQGGPQERRWLVERVGDEAIRQWMMAHQGRGLTVRQMAPWIDERTARRWQRANPAARFWEER